MGYGDFKLFAALRGLVRVGDVVPVLLFSSLVGAVVGSACCTGSARPQIRTSRSAPTSPSPAGCALLFFNDFLDGDFACSRAWGERMAWPRPRWPHRRRRHWQVHGRQPVRRTRGVPIVDTDVLAREVVAPGTPALAAGRGPVRTRRRCGRRPTVRGLRAHVFADPTERRGLEALTHPAIRALADVALHAVARPLGAGCDPAAGGDRRRPVSTACWSSTPTPPCSSPGCRRATAPHARRRSGCSRPRPRARTPRGGRRRDLNDGDIAACANRSKSCITATSRRQKRNRKRTAT